MALSGPRFPLVGRRFDRDRFRRARLDARLTQPELADRAGISTTWVKMLEAKTARHQPTILVAEALAEALGCTLDDICPPDNADTDAA